MVLLTLEELNLFNKRTEELLKQDPSWANRELDIANMVIEELKNKQ